MNHGKLLVCFIIKESDPCNCDSTVQALPKIFLKMKDDTLRLSYCDRFIIIYSISLICFTERIRGQNLCYEAPWDNISSSFQTGTMAQSVFTYSSQMHPSELLSMPSVIRKGILPCNWGQTQKT